MMWLVPDGSKAYDLNSFKVLRVIKNKETYKVVGQESVHSISMETLFETDNFEEAQKCLYDLCFCKNSVESCRNILQLSSMNSWYPCSDSIKMANWFTNAIPKKEDNHE